MKHLNNITILTVVVLMALLSACGNNQQKKQTTKKTSKENINVPRFNADSAYHFVARQVAFGPRVPNTPAHDSCAAYLKNTLLKYTSTVIVQEFQERAYNGTVLNGKNIIASFNPEQKKRILLTSHWDSRPFADHDPDKSNHHTAIDGANDGASGVGILLEMARLMATQSPEVGVDIVFFDLEDYGVPHFEGYSDNDSWALGSRYWANNPHDPSYTANFGILLDMVGAKDPIFKMEYYSMYFAPNIVKKVWKQAGILGYGSTFLFEDGGMVMDDHIPVNTILGIPMIDIIHYDPSTESGFFPYWHTINDNMETINKVSLMKVGNTLTNVVYYE